MSRECDIPTHDCPRAGLRASAPLMRHELRRFNLSDRERCLASLILSLSWEEGIAAVRVPKLDFFSHLTGIAENHVSETLYDLVKLMKVVVVGETAEGKYYSLNDKTDTWQAKPRVSRPTMLDTLNIIREINGISRQTEDQLNFKFEVLAKFLSAKSPVQGVIPKQEEQ
jgi:hypothetical protein